MQFDSKQFGTLDWVITAGAAVAFITLFLPWQGVTAGPIDVSADAWSSGFSAWAGALLLTVAGVLLVLRRSGASLSSTVGPALLVAAVGAVGLLLVVIRWVSLPNYHGAGLGFNYSYGARYGLYLALIAGIAIVTAAVMELRASGEQVPWAQAEQQPEPTEPEPEPPAAPEE
jgi:hypothetical protein